jgi:hypothetical protein
VSAKFRNSISGGFAAVGEPNVAVCLLPGTEVAFEKEVECEHGLGLLPNWRPEKKLGEKVASVLSDHINSTVAALRRYPRRNLWLERSRFPRLHDLIGCAGA